MKAMKMEYLAIISSEDSFCRNSAAFKSLLQSDSDIKISGKKIKHKSFEVNFELQEGHNEEKKHRYYHLRLKSESEDIDAFSKMSRAIRTMLHLASKGNVQTLWDDISFHYAQISYPYIHEIENLMRKLITKFMLTNVGLGWTKETMLEDIRRSPRAEKQESSSNYLYEVDFIQLSEFLFNEYRTLDINALIKKISGLSSETVNVSEISEFIPKSNWKRYFEPYVDCDATYLQSRWQKLYDLRCKIAHNNTFSKKDHTKALELASEVREKLEKAIGSLDEISVPEDEREDLVESVASHSNIGAATFITKWKMIEQLSKQLYDKNQPSRTSEWPKNNRINNYQLFNSLINSKTISANTYKKIKDAQKLRNTVVHELFNPFTETELLLLSNQIDDIVEDLHSKLRHHQDPDISKETKPENESSPSAPTKETEPNNPDTSEPNDQQ